MGFARVVVPGSLLVVVFFGCGGGEGDTGSSSGASSTEAQAACDQYYDALRAFLQRCNAGELSSTRAEHVAHDRERFRAVCVGAFELPGTSVTPAVVSACAGAIQARTDCNAFGDVESETCDIEPGTLDDGSPCVDDAQCKGYCKTDESNVTCGRCATRASSGGSCSDPSECPNGESCVDGTCSPPAGEGETCSLEVFPSCRSGLYCDFASSTCLPERASGEACSTSLECGSLLTCVNGTCSSRLGEGADCSDPDASCALGLECADDTQKCVKPTYGRPGERCDGKAARCEIGFCPITANGEGVCPTILADGQPCDPADRSSICDAYALCIDGTCQLPLGSNCR